MAAPRVFMAVNEHDLSSVNGLVHECHFMREREKKNTISLLLLLLITNDRDQPGFAPISFMPASTLSPGLMSTSGSMPVGFAASPWKTAVKVLYTNFVKVGSTGRRPVHPDIPPAQQSPPKDKTLHCRAQSEPCTESGSETTAATSLKVSPQPRSTFEKPRAKKQRRLKSTRLRPASSANQSSHRTRFAGDEFDVSGIIDVRGVLQAGKCDARVRG